MSISPPMLVPMTSGFVYAIAALLLKRGGESAGPWRVTFIVNWVMAIVFAAGWFAPAENPITASNLAHAAISGVFFFFGNVCTFLALTRGDVSVATPVLGSKVIFVALFTVILGMEQLSASIWAAVALTACATTLLGGGGGHVPGQQSVLFRSLLYGFGAAAIFAMMDISQQRWIREWSLVPYMSALYLTMALLSLGLWPFFRNDGRTLTGANWRWLVSGATLIAIQASGVAWGVVHLGATTTNVLYNSRGVWSVALVWAVGSWFGNKEGARGNKIMVRRLAGALVLLSAIFLLTKR